MSARSVESTGPEAGGDSATDSETESTKDSTDDDSDSSPTDLSPFDLSPSSPAPPQNFGECRLPLGPASDPDLSPDSGLRFGTQRESYLEFRRKLKIKKRSEFSLEFKTTEPDGIIFYAAHEGHNDFVALFLKNGTVSIDCVDP